MPQKYKQILQDNLMFSFESLKRPSDYIFQQDYDPKHTVKSTFIYLSRYMCECVDLAVCFLYVNNVYVLEWLSESSDFNLYGNLWRFLKIQIRKIAPKNIHNMKTI